MGDGAEWWAGYDEGQQQQSQQMESEAQMVLYGDELNQPAWAAGFVRCACRHGVPRNSRAHSAVPDTRYVGDILINMGNSQEEYLYGQGSPPPKEYISHIFTYLLPGDMGRAAIAGRCFHDLVWRDPQYYDVSQMAVQASFEAHDDYVEGIVYRHGRLYTCGERRCKLWDPVTGECLKVMFRDQTNIVSLCLEEPRFFYSFMANGTFRKWKLTFKPDVMDFAALFGEHCGRINAMVLSPPSEGHCQRHTMLNHSCFLYTCSDDRTTKVWDTSTNACLATITPPTFRSSTIRSLALSGRHIFLGSSRGQVFVYSLHRVCERQDVHNCQDPRIGPQRFCLQSTLSHGDTIIRCLLTAGPSYSRSFLFSGSVDGSICVWRIPDVGLDFPVYALWKTAHSGAVNALTASWNHLYSASADSLIKVWKLSDSPCYVRSLPGNGQDIKSLCIAEEATEEEGGRRLFAGLSTGLVIGINIGTYG